MEPEQPKQNEQPPSQQTGVGAQIWGFLYSFAASYLYGDQQQAVREALAKVNQSDEGWPLKIPGEVWLIIAQNASEENISTLVHLSRVNKSLSIALRPYLADVSKQFDKGAIKETYLENRIRVVTTQQALDEALQESAVHLIIVEITQGNETDFTISHGKEFSDTKFEARGEVNVLVKYPGFEITSKEGAHVSVYEGCAGYASHSGSVTVYTGAQGHALQDGFVIVHEGGKGNANKGGSVTVTEGGDATAHAQGHVTVKNGGLGYASKDGQVTVESGGYGHALKGGHVTVETGGQGRVEVEGGQIVVHAGGEAIATNGGLVVAESGGGGMAKDGGHVVVQIGGVGIAHQSGHLSVGEGGMGIVHEGGHAVVESGGECEVDAGGTAVAHPGSIVLVKESGAIVQVMVDAGDVEIVNGVIYLNGDPLVYGPTTGEPVPNNVTFTDINGRPLR